MYSTEINLTADHQVYIRNWCSVPNSQQEHKSQATAHSLSAILFYSSFYYIVTATAGRNWTKFGCINTNWLTIIWMCIKYTPRTSYLSVAMCQCFHFWRK